MYVLTILISIFLVSCGDKSETASTGQIAELTATEKPDYTSYYFKAKSDLGDCNEEKQNWLAYVKSEKKFYACSESSWFVVEQEKTEVLREVTTFENNEFLWQENESGVTWVLLSTAKNHPYIESKGWSYICEENGYTTPLRSEIVRASRNGLYLNLIKRSAGEQIETVWFEEDAARKDVHDRMSGVYNAKAHYLATDSVGYVYDVSLEPTEIVNIYGFDVENTEFSGWTSAVVCKR